MAVEDIRIGVLATLIGPYLALGEDGLRGLKQAVDEFGGQIIGKKISLFTESTNAMGDSAVEGARTLLDKHNVDFIIGPLSGTEGLAIRDFAKTRPDITFINGASGTQDTTLRDPAANFFRFNTDGAQWVVGLGDYIYNTLGYKRIATLAEDYSYPHTQIGGLMLEYCKLGGRVIEKIWVGLGKTDYRAIIDEIPSDIDAVFVALGGTDAVSFFTQYEAQSRRFPMIGGTLTTDHTVLQSLPRSILGVVSGSLIADDNPTPEWQIFRAAFQQRNNGSPPSILAYMYYVNTKAALLALRDISGDLSNGQRRYQRALSELVFTSPSGMVRLDENRHAIADVFVTQVSEGTDGKRYNRLLQTTSAVTQTLGIPRSEYLAMKPFSRTHPECS